MSGHDCCGVYPGHHAGCTQASYVASPAPVTAASGADPCCSVCDEIGGPHGVPTSGADAGDAYLDGLAETTNPTLQRAVAAVRAERAASGADQLTLRGQLVEVLFEHRRQQARQIPGVRSDDDMPLLLRVLRAESERFVDALLPLIEAREERAKAEGGAEALEKAADWLTGSGPDGSLPGGCAPDETTDGLSWMQDVGDRDGALDWCQMSLRDRAASLRATTGQQPDRPTT